MIIEFIPGIACFMCAFVERNNPVKIIPFAVPLGILVCLFAITNYYEIIIVRIILVFLMLIIVFVYPFFKKIKDKKVHKNTKT